MKRISALALGVAAFAVAQGCSNEPGLYLSGPAGPAAQVKVSNSNLTMIIGDSLMVAARAEDAVGNATTDATTLSPCDGVSTVTSQSSSPEWATVAYIKGASLGASCVVATAAGITDTIRVSVGPAGVMIVGPDVVGSGNDGAYTVVAVDRAGTELTGTVQYAWASSNTARLAVDKDNGAVIGKSPGAVDVRLVAPGGANAKKTLSVNPGVFAGTLSATSAAPGALVTATRAADGPKFDADVTAKLDAFGTFVDGFTDNTVTFAVPATGSTAAGVLTLANMSFEQIAQTIAFTSTKATGDVYGPANLDPATDPDVDAVKSANGNVYMTSAGLCSGGGGADCDDFFTITAGASDRTVKVTLTWNNSEAATGDLDILWCNADCSAYVGNFDGAGSSKPEVSTVTIPAGETWHLWINNYSQTATQWSNIKVTLQ